MSEQQPEADQTSDPTDSSDQADQSDRSGTSEEPKRELDSGEPGDIGDDQLPADLQPTEDNPLARHPGQTGEDEDQIGADREDDPDTAPLTEDDADYGSGDRDSS